MAAMVGNLGDSVSWDTSHLATSRQSWHGGHVLQVITWWSIRENYHRWDDCRHEATHLARHSLAGRHILTAQTQGRGHWPLVPPFLRSFPRGQWPFIRPPAASVVSLNLECHGEQEKSGGDLQRNGFNIKIVPSHLGPLTTISTRKRVMARGSARPWPPKKILSTDEKRPPSSCFATSSLDCAPCSAYWSP